MIMMVVIVKAALMVALMVAPMVVAVMLAMWMIALVMVIAVQNHGLVMDCLTVRIPTIMVVI